MAVGTCPRPAACCCLELFPPPPPSVSSNGGLFPVLRKQTPIERGYKAAVIRNPHLPCTPTLVTHCWHIGHTFV